MESKDNANRFVKPALYQDDNAANMKSATGNPKNKYALKPGHSLMDWIRLGNSGKDLTGTGKEPGKSIVTRHQLAEHCSSDDIWISLNRKVYNVTNYMEFHPGGPSQLMKAAGKDATKLFNETHPWVNYETILQKCLIGPLQYDCSGNKSERDNENENQNESIDKQSEKFRQLTHNQVKQSVSIESDTDLVAYVPRFDWIQKSSTITVYFYTKSYSNPLIAIEKLENKQLTNIRIRIVNDQNTYVNAIKFAFNIDELLKSAVNYETGRIEISFRKEHFIIWPNFGELQQSLHDYTSTVIHDSYKYSFVMDHCLPINHNTYLLSFHESNVDAFYVPIGCHFNVQAIIKGTLISRSYTPIPCLFATKHSGNAKNCIHFMVKNYKKGMMSSFLCSQKIGYKLETSGAFTPLSLKLFDDFYDFLIIAAGTGITPMLSLLSFLLTRRLRKTNKIEMLFFNCTEKDILLKNELEHLEKQEPRLRIRNILSEPSESWNGPRGSINMDILRINLNKFSDIKSVFCTICGPEVFTNLTKAFLSQLHLHNSQIHCFL